MATTSWRCAPAPPCSSGRLGNKILLRLSGDVSWIQYRAPLLGQKNQGWSFYGRASVEQELPWMLVLEAAGSYSGRPIMLQGKGPENFSYRLNLYRTFLDNNLLVSIDASSFIPVGYKRNRTSEGPGYSSTSWDKEFHANFGLMIRYTFGKLRSRVKESEIDIRNNDIKRDYTE